METTFNSLLSVGFCNLGGMVCQEEKEDTQIHIAQPSWLQTYSIFFLING